MIQFLPFPYPSRRRRNHRILAKVNFLTIDSRRVASPKHETFHVTQSLLKCLMRMRARSQVSCKTPPCDDGVLHAPSLIRKTPRHADRGCPWRSVFRFFNWPSLEQIFEPRNTWCQTFPKVQYPRCLRLDAVHAQNPRRPVVQQNLSNSYLQFIGPAAGCWTTKTNLRPQRPICGRPGSGGPHCGGSGEEAFCAHPVAPRRGIWKILAALESCR